MPQEITDPWLICAILALAAISVATWVWLIARRNRLGTFLPYEQRRPVPWNAFATFLAILFVAMSLSTVVEPLTAATDNTAQESLEPHELSASIALQAFSVGAFFLVVVAAFHATPSDLGLPRDAHQAMRDIGIGVVAWLASIVPVHVLNILVSTLFYSGAEDEHPLIEMMLENPQPLIMFLGAAMAVVVAPLSEEITFRLLLQGWLEKWEDRRWFERDSVPSPFIDVADVPLGQADGTAPDAPIAPLEQPAIAETPPPTSIDTSATSTDRLQTLCPAPTRGLFGLPHGWAPILVSSVLFASAHVGYGATAILPLAIILGYVYQRTHRILPCIVTHALFNLTSTLFLWRIISLQSG